MSEGKHEPEVSAATIRADLSENWLPIAKALLTLSKSMNYEKVDAKDGSIIAAVIEEAATELLTFKAAHAEMLKALHDANVEFIGLSAYLETCAADVIVENLPTIVASLKRKQEQIEAAAIRKARG